MTLKGSKQSWHQILVCRTRFPLALTVHGPAIWCCLSELGKWPNTGGQKFRFLLLYFLFASLRRVQNGETAHFVFLMDRKLNKTYQEVHFATSETIIVFKETLKPFVYVGLRHLSKENKDSSLASKHKNHIAQSSSRKCTDNATTRWGGSSRWGDDNIPSYAKDDWAVTACSVLTSARRFGFYNKTFYKKEFFFHKWSASGYHKVEHMATELTKARVTYTFHYDI